MDQKKMNILYNRKKMPPLDDETVNCQTPGYEARWPLVHAYSSTGVVNSLGTRFFYSTPEFSKELIYDLLEGSLLIAVGT